jgi:UrcA family protein
MKETFKIIAMSAMATAAVIKAVPAFSEPAPAQNVSIVHTSDLDLSTEAGRAVLDHRLVIAAHDVCGTAADVDLSGKNKIRACRAETIAKARAETAQLANRAGPVLVATAR